MAALPPASQVAGSNQATYESLFRQVDKTGVGKIGAVDAASFLKKSGLRETILHKIWELSDPQGKGHLDKQGFFVALKLIALAQSGREIAVSNLTLPAPIPNMQGSATQTPHSTTPPLPGGSPDHSWSVTPEEKLKYDAIFEGLNPIDQKLSGDKVKTVFMNSNLPVDILSRIWDLSDIDKDGLLDKDEFAVAMHLVYRALEKEPTPMTLPPQLLPPPKRKKPPMAGAIAVLPSPVSTKRATPPIPSDGSPKGSPVLSTKQEQSTWVVTSEEKAKSDQMFSQIDGDKDGLVGGEEVRPLLLQSGLPQNILAQIWNLCDTKQTGQLSAEQFALVMYLVNQAKAGTNPPPVLTPEMVPPTLRPKPGKAAMSGLQDLAAGVGSQGDFSAIKELDTISKEIENLSKEKGQLQVDIRTKEEHVKMKTLEVQGLQSELDKSTSQCKQLETQKAEAQKRLDELDQQRSKLEGLLAEVREQCSETQGEVDSLQGQIASQESSLKAQEEELKTARVELNNLRQEEVQLEQQLQSGKTQLDMVKESTKGVEQEYQVLQAKLKSLVESKNKLNSQMQQLDQTPVIPSGIPSLVPHANNNQGTIQGIEELGPLSRISSIDTDLLSTRATAGNSPVSSLSGFSTTSETRRADEDFKDDPFKGRDPFAGFGDTNAADPFQSSDPFTEDPFKNEGFSSDPFGGDPFKNSTSSDPFPSSSSDPFSSKTTPDPFGDVNSDPFKGGDPFASKGPSLGADDPFAVSSSSVGGADDPFKSKDPFRAGGTPTSAKTDAFGSIDPFGGDAFKPDAFMKGSGTDTFGSDPFNPKEETPALPPKKSKTIGAKLATVSTPASTTSATTAVNSTPDAFAAFGGDSGADPFGSMTSQADPFGGDPFASSASTTTAKEGSVVDPFASFADFGSAKASSKKPTGGIVSWQDASDSSQA
ncbi:epidermal growth factor receptor substrate 15-like 1 isoform X2 [Acanthaster planci]|uniref:Epidermal growth factor receptor substrate 15-like 1 isoform X2 n=1 Tax=Acanthaster planci TaxID=133434 RepID=A0A8B7Y4D2_ACAPL|nr:epidermal growth factor receptor substrate 15-like 1 isoform X2 [Acanthaster planci]